jgi:hypothetical protein
MVNFNPNILSDPVGGIALEYGVPSCMVNLSKEILGLLPGNVLAGLDFGMREGRAKAEMALAKINNTIFADLGIIEFDEATGKFKILSDTSRWGADSFGSGILGDVGNFLGQLAGAGTALWQNYQVLADQVEIISNCIGEFEGWLNASESKSNTGSSNDVTKSQGKFALYQQQTSKALSFIERADEQIRNIQDIMQQRADNPSLEPVFVDQDGESVEDPIFRLTYGPPVAKKGSFLISQDGLYYDSQGRDYLGGDIPSEMDIGMVADETKWKLDHAPSLGGRGTAFSMKELNDYVNTMFDTDKVDDSKTLKEYYESDHLLQTIEAQRNVHVERINDSLGDILDEGYQTDSALYINYLEQLNSTVAGYDIKMRKRKKQIEVAVKAPDLFGVDDVYAPGEVPVNDFSFLSSINLGVELEKQRGLVFDHGEVSGVVLPLRPKFVQAEEGDQSVVVVPMNVTMVGTGSVLDGEETEGDAPVISITTNIEMVGAISVYNFTDANFVSTNSTEFKTLNCAAAGKENRAQMVTGDVAATFAKGLGIPYLQGICIVDKENAVDSEGEDWNTYDVEIQEPGTYMRLPDTPPFQNLMYDQSGCTIETWTSVKNLDTEAGTSFWRHPFTTSSFDHNMHPATGAWGESHFYRLLLACENTGGEDRNIEVSSNITRRSSDSVRGMVMGFSRDPKMYYEDGVVDAGDTDWDVRLSNGYGAIITSLTADNHFEPGPASSGSWELSTDISNNFAVNKGPQASGTWTSTSTGKVTYSVKWSDGYTASSDGEQYRISASGTDGIYTAPASGLLSGTPDINLYDTGDDFELQMGATSSVFFIAPTQSYNTTGVSFVKKGDCAENPAQLRRFVVGTHTQVTDSNGDTVALKDLLDDEMAHLVTTFDPGTDSIKFYVNGELIKTGTISETFGVDVGTPPQVPSFVFPSTDPLSSFEYKSATVTRSESAEDSEYFETGPKTNQFFTPWIVGGGWTDGRPVDLATSSGGFMSTGDGIVSSYNGYVGSMKFYCRALNNDEVTQNYDAQKTFFQNVVI